MREPWSPSAAHEAWSRRLNRRLGGGDELLCARIWRWRLLTFPLVALIDVALWLGPRRLGADGIPRHCRRMALRERRRREAEEVRRLLDWTGP